jgi:PAS domain-containing protein
VSAPAVALIEGQPLDYRGAFDLAPVGLVLSRQRLMIDCNRELLAMFGARREDLIGQSFECSTPRPDELNAPAGALRRNWTPRAAMPTIV